MRHLLLAVSLLVFSSVYVHASDGLVLEPTLTNVENVPAGDLKAIVQYLNRRTYTDLGELAESVRFTFQKYGYFKVEVEEPVVPIEASTVQKGTVAVTVSVTSGDKYRLGGITFSDSSLFPSAELRQAFPIRDGDVFDREKIGLGLENLRTLYEDKGYVNFSAVPDTEVNEAERTVSLDMDVDAGQLFRVGTLTVRDDESEPGAREKLLKTWKAYEGRVYDSHVLERFLRDLHARPQLKPDQVFETSQDSKDHVIKVYITLARPIY